MKVVLNNVSDSVHENKVTSEEAAKNEKVSIFETWFKDEEGSTDGSDDGKITFKEGAKSFGKGFFGVVINVVKHPLTTALGVVMITALNAATGKAMLPAFVAAGLLIGAGQIGYGFYKAATAKNDKTARQAFEKMGSGTFAVAASAIGAKKALLSAAEGGVKSAEGLACANPIKNAANCIKVSKDSVVQSGANIKGNFLTFTTGKIHANSNILRKNQIKYMSKPNEAKSYRFNPNGTDEEILANNPGVFKGGDGRFYVNNKWNPEHPFVIDSSKEQMIMQYGPDDMAVCDGKIFEGSYVDSVAFKGKGELNYQKPSNLEYGKVVDVTKQARGACTRVPVGTKVQTLEGMTVVQEGQAIAIDHAGNPYVSTVESIIKRNIPLEGYEEAFKNLQSA